MPPTHLPVCLDVDFETIEVGVGETLYRCELCPGRAPTKSYRDHISSAMHQRKITEREAASRSLGTAPAQLPPKGLAVEQLVEEDRDAPDSDGFEWDDYLFEAINQLADEQVPRQLFNIKKATSSESS
ncbi:uncharacterized protein PGTG_19179 [Puccinia graminis f. sp. tritici CRL 75-36-700-3]|uniref:U1-type domain-containing protein n=1 Tax=Puccinia graminis f. sp. tritici (strain CRL 75-36-700-3 / race SCCL) TaxID=418459 RepID=E3L9K8_PUCGT|nr:uncharacterized protein PGTG_19179 [Puccinia graminis f. sp. tritici CRL 75-36-700-3]EFP93233.2 hypothetical protein PGTG_19179 [Puccinia graminis f. sp. tritici CRL 75-36-700-3]